MGIPFITNNCVSTPFSLTLILCVGISERNVLAVGMTLVLSLPAVTLPAILTSAPYEILFAMELHELTRDVEMSPHLNSGVVPNVSNNVYLKAEEDIGPRISKFPLALKSAPADLERALL
jgi:hypothetical protein